MAVTMVVSLYSVRLVLAALGESDYGIFNVIGGVVAMLSFFQTALSVSTQRYLSFYHGKGDKNLLIQVFNNSVALHIAMGIIVVGLLEIIGRIFIDYYLQIPNDRIDVAKTIFHFSCASVFFSIIGVPYTAVINANERLIFIAVISILESFEKLGLAIFLSYTGYDKLFVFGFFMAVIMFVSFVFYFITCKRKFDECRHFDIHSMNKSLLKDLMGFASWNVVGSLTTMSKNQGMSILFNIFKGPTVNAAYAVAHQVSAQLQFFSATMLRAMNPQIMKSEGCGNHPRMLRLSLTASKFGFLLLAFFAIPCIFEMDFILGIWLKNVPKHTAYFCDLILVAMLFDQLTVGVNSAFQACKLVKHSTIFVGATKLLILPVGYILLKMEMSVYTVVLGYAVVELLAGWVRVVLAKKMMKLSILSYVGNVYLKIFVPVLLSVLGCFLASECEIEPYRIILTMSLSTLLFLPSVYFCSMDENEKQIVRNMMSKIKRGKCA